MKTVLGTVTGLAFLVMLFISPSNFFATGNNIGERIERATTPRDEQIAEEVRRRAALERDLTLPAETPRYVEVEVCDGSVPTKAADIPQGWNVSADWSPIVLETWYRRGTWVKDDRPAREQSQPLSGNYDAVAYCLKPLAESSYRDDLMRLRWSVRTN